MSFEVLLVVLAVVGILAVAGVLFAVLTRSRSSGTEDALGRGSFIAVLESLKLEPRQSLMARPGLLRARAVAAKHRLELDLALADLEALLSLDPNDGEALLELGLVHGYAGRPERAGELLVRAAQVRADLSESIQLHRAWCELAGGERRRALALFEEIEAPLENKLRQDLGAGEPLFVEWFLHASRLWAAKNDPVRARWALAGARSSAPESRLIEGFETFGVENSLSGPQGSL